MDAPDYQRLKSLLLRARELAPPERDALLTDLDRTDPDIATELRSLLAHESSRPDLRTAAPLEQAAGAFGAAIPERIGNYEILETLGEGGMGIVLRARQTAPFEREVALKLIRSVLPSSSLRERFLAERQTLAQLDHPNIASVHDAGADEFGRPYLVMELVSGQDLVSYAQEKRLALRARIELFLQVCAAVQHAHQRGILHRDIKTSNVLVSEVDGRPLAKVIDFGIAKAIDQGELGLTRADQAIGTPDSMSPEQAGVLDLPVDTRSDVYALGVLLCQLLSGQVPYHFRSGSLAEWQSMLEGAGPRMPSLLATGSTARALRGDLDAIVLKALRKLPADRYASVDRLAEDLQRHLSGQPVLARAGNWRYNAGKFLRRHRAAASVTALLLVGLLGFLSALAAQSQRLARERDRALLAEARAEGEAERARRVSSFLVELFEVADPNEARGNSVTAREVLDRGVERIRDELQDEPQIKAGLLDAMGRVYRSLGLFAQAESLLIESARLAASAPAMSPLERSEVLLHLGGILQDLGRYARADSIYAEAVAIRERELGDQSSTLAEALGYRVSLYLDTGDIDAAEPLIERVLALHLEHLGPNHPEVAIGYNDRGSIRLRRGRFVEAIQSYHESLRIHQLNFGRDHPEIATNLANIGVAYGRLGELDSAVVYDRRGLEMRERVLGPDHVHTGISANNLASHLHALGRYEEALELLERALALKIAAEGPRHRSTGHAWLGLGRLLTDMGDHPRAEEYLHTALDIHMESVGEQFHGTGSCMVALAKLYARMEDRTRALHWARESVRVYAASMDEQHPSLLQANEQLAQLVADSLAGRQ